jgi:hypothetical protein
MGILPSLLKVIVMNFKSPTSYSNYFYLCFSDSLKLNTNVSFVSSHPNIGLSFERFNGRRYISNAEMMTLFPDDEAFALSLVG